MAPGTRYDRRAPVSFMTLTNAETRPWCSFMAATSSESSARSTKGWAGSNSDSPLHPVSTVYTAHEEYGNAHPRGIWYSSHTMVVVEATVGNFLSQHASEIWSFIAGIVGGGAGGSLLTLRLTRQNKVRGSGS